MLCKCSPQLLLLVIAVMNKYTIPPEGKPSTCPRRTSGVRVATRQTWQVIMVRPCLRTCYGTANHTFGIDSIWMMVFVTEERRVNRGSTTSTNAQASHRRRCCASRTPEVDGQPKQQSETSIGIPNVARESLEFN